MAVARSIEEFDMPSNTPALYWSTSLTLLFILLALNVSQMWPESSEHL